MQKELISQEGLVSDFKITISHKDIQQHVENWLSEQAKKVRVDGFRPGKVPMSYMRKQHGKQARSISLEHFMTEALQQAVKDHNINPSDQPEIKVEQGDEEKDFIFSASFEAQPTFELVDNEKISFEQLVIKADEGALTKTLENLLSSQKEKDKEAKLDDNLAKLYGAKDLDDLKEKIKETFERDQNELSWVYTKRQILDQLEALYQFELPQRLVKKEFERIWQQALKEIEAEGTTDKDNLKEQRELYQKLAERRIKLGFIVASMTKEYNISLSKEEINQVVYQELMRYPNDAKKIIDYYQNNPAAVHDLTAPQLEDKVITHISKEAKVKKVTVSAQEAQKKIEEIMPLNPKKIKKTTSQKVEKKAKIKDKV